MVMGKSSNERSNSACRMRCRTGFLVIIGLPEIRLAVSMPNLLTVLSGGC